MNRGPVQADAILRVGVGPGVPDPFLDRSDGQVAPLGQALDLRGRQRTRHLLAGEVGAVARRTRLLPPRVRERSGVEGVEPGVLDQRHGHLAVPIAVGGDGDGDAVRAPRGPALGRERVEPIAFHALAIGRPSCSVTHRLST
ncbi:hypothetical protein TR631_36920 [Streptomyces rochei]|uniref:hypothetical protein n=1 Tax=Streptomyces rochei TaxID=1928 RepID=UPI002ACE1381|nr:hypothetical protein [Streptomyces rochei]WQC17120.1 hypothetical protein TR631_36920 [Streptomyces rochei]